MRRSLLLALLFSVLSVTVSGEETGLEQYTEMWKKGETLPESVFQKYSLPQSPKPKNDTGINILVDLNRTCKFAWLWRNQGQFAQNGFRICATQATLDTVLNPQSRCRVRVKLPDAEPFAWWTPPEFNVVIIHAGSPNQQQFLPEEIETLKKFVQNGGGIVLITATTKLKEEVDAWSFNKLLAAFEAAVLPESEKTETGSGAVLKLGASWEPLATGSKNGVVRARRTFGKGRVLIVENDAAICYENATKGEETNEAVQKLIEETKKRQAQMISWVAAGKPPVGGDGALPQARGGGGGIFPDQELRANGIVAYYAKNQLPDLLKVVREDLPKVTKLVYEWLPSSKPEEPIMFILSAGSGGGWAVNIRLPKEVGIISTNYLGIIGIFAHEQAHTMRGPTNFNGTYGIRPAHDLSGEAHAGWFQGKALATFNEKAREQSNRNCNSILADQQKFLSFDFVTHYQKNDSGFPKGFGWTKLWWVWQKLDDKYGTTWYPRWYWVRATRWQGDTNRVQSWDETIEDMSIAVGEDLFPFFKKIGTTLKKDRFPEVEFQGERLTLPVASIDMKPAGNVRLEPVGDYTKPL